MIQRRRVRDSTIIDAIEASSAAEFEGLVWRVVREDRDPTRGSSPGGRWDDGTFDVLYTSLESDGALAELYFHIMRGQPVFPSKLDFCLYELMVLLRRALQLADLDAVEALGVEVSRFGSLEQVRKQEEYQRMQEISETAHFLEFDGLIVPSARWTCQNVVIFSDRVPPEALSISQNRGPVDWAAWERNRENHQHR